MTPLPWGPRALLGVVHLGPLAGQSGFAGLDGLVAAAVADQEALERGGAGAILVENWKDESPGPFVDPGAVASLAVVVRTLARATSLPVGVNVLPNDYRTAFSLAACGARFVQLDVFVDRVRTDYTYSRVPAFEVAVDTGDVAAWRERAGASGVPLLATVHPKHYLLLEERSLEDSVRAALGRGADAVVVTGTATGSPPTPERVAAVKRAAGDAPVVVGSGLDEHNAAGLMRYADAAIVGTSLKPPDLSYVIEDRVRIVVRAMRE